jgi:hypothetical protein
MQRNNEEYNEQKLVVQYLELKKVKFTAIPNSTYTQSWGQKSMNKAMGVRAGLPDMFLIIKNQPLFLEMKKKKGGKLSEYQKSWYEAINKAGIPCYVCNGFEEAKKVIDKYL